MAEFTGVLILLVLLLVICWIVLPFAVIGTKPLLRQLIAETQRTNALLEQRLPDLRPRTTSVIPPPAS